MRKLGCYDQVVTYDEVATLDAANPAVYVDMAGNDALRRSVHEHFGDQLKHSCTIGATHWDQTAGGDEGLPGPKPEFFFAPAQIQKRAADWGPAELQRRLGRGLVGLPQLQRELARGAARLRTRGRRARLRGHSRRPHRAATRPRALALGRAVRRAAAARKDSTDGRVLRTLRSRGLIVDALFELVGEGHLEPTAQQVSERAGVCIRTVFRLFEDMDDLYATMNARLLDEVLPLLADPPPAGSDLGERAAALVADRAEVFERVAPYMRSTRLHRSRSPFLADEFRNVVRRLRARLLDWIPELRAAPSDLLEALDQATSFEAWDRLRGEQRLGSARARAAMERSVRALVRELEDTQ